MPLARIVTRTPLDAVAASDYLRSLGYTVETVSPGEFRVTPAELELVLGKCRPEEAVARAMALVEARRSAPAPEPGVPAEPIAPEKPKVAIAYDIAGRPVEFAGEAEEERRAAPTSIGRAMTSMLARGRKGVLELATRSAAIVMAPLRNFRHQRAERRAMKLEFELAQEREQMRQEEQQARERIERDIERRQLAAERSRQEHLAAEGQAREQQEARVQAERQAEAERQAALRAEHDEQARVAAMHEAMIAAQRQQEAPEPPPQQSTEALPAPAQNPIGREAEAPVVAPPTEPLPTLAAAREALRHKPPQRVKLVPRRTPGFSSPRRWMTPHISRTAVAVAAGAAFTLVLGFVAYANRRPASPLSTGTLVHGSAIKQQTPFGAATITPPPVAVIPKPSPTAPKPPAVTAGPKPSAGVAANRTTPHNARRLRPSPQEDSVAEDEVVVRHLQRSQQPQPKQQVTTSAAKLKRYTDVE